MVQNKEKTSTLSAKIYAICQFVIWCNFHSNFQFQLIASDSRYGFQLFQWSASGWLDILNHELADAV